MKDVWKKTQNVNVIIRGNDTQFDNYKLPIFFNLCITSTGLKASERSNIKTLVEENGGRYNSSFTAAVDILIMEKDSIGSQKFNAATKLKKLCLRTAWIIDSVKDGFAMPVEAYKLSSAQTRAASTPTKISDANLTISKFNPDNTQLSDISRATFCRRDDISLSETTASSRLSIACSSTSNQGFKQTLADAKKVGSVLDGYNILLSGLSTADVPLVSKIISVLGATKMDSINDQVTHVVVGTIDPQLFVDLDEQHIEAVVLKAEWLKRIVEKKSLVDESQFTISRPTTSKEKAVPEKPSPASKKAMKSLSGVFKKPDLPKFRLEEANREQEELDLLSHYLDEPSLECVKFLTGKYVFVYGYSDLQEGAFIINECEKFGATLVDGTFRNEVDYVITAPGVIAEISPQVKYKNIVSDLWIGDSAEAGACVEPLYYHQPVAKLKPHEQPLKNEVFVVSNYKSAGRSFINMLVENLGGKYKEIMKRADNGILISPNDEGKKFESAKLWSWSVVSVDWLLACLDKKQRVDETPFLIGGAHASTRNQKEARKSIVPSSQGLVDDDSIIEPPANESHFTPARRRVTEVLTPKTPMTPVLNVERLVEEMVTPQRQHTLAVLKENESKRIVSPRQKRLDAIINTPSTRHRLMTDDVDSPRPELPECMKPNSMYFGIRPDTTPNTEACHKRKFESLDSQYIPPPEKKRPIVQEAPTVSDL